MFQARVPLSRSCRACIRAKKKCDLVLPICGRCEEKGVECAYANQPLRGDVQKASRVTACRAVAKGRQNGVCRTDPQCSRCGPREEPVQLLSCIEPTFHGVPMSLDEDTIRYMAAVFRKVPALFVLGGKTPSLDVTIYGQGIPAPMKEIYSVCEILITKTVDAKAASQMLDAKTPGMCCFIPSFQPWSTGTDSIVRLQS